MDEKILSYMNLDVAYQSKAIPYKNNITFLSKMSGMPQIWTLDDSQEPVQYAEFNDTITNVHHSPNGDMSIVEKDNNGNEKQQFYLLLHESEPKIEDLVVSSEHIHIFGGWSPDSSRIVYSSNRRNFGFFDIYVLDIKTKKAEKIFEHDGNCNPITWTSDGKSILIDIPDNSLDQNIYKLDINTGAVHQLSSKNTKARYQSFVLPKCSKVGFVLTDLGEDTMYIAKIDLGKFRNLEKLIHYEEWDIQELKISSDEQRLIYTLNEGGFFKLYLYDLNTNKHKLIPNIPKGVVESISWMNEDQLVFSINTPTCPGDIWRYTLSTDVTERLTHISYSEELKNSLYEPRICKYESFDGLEVPYFYYEKSKEENRPTLLYIHGGPSVQTRAEFNFYIQYLVEQGFSVAAPNVRGSNGYGRKYLGLDDVRKRMDSVKDVVWLVKDLVNKHNIDPDRVGIMGRSYGGFMVLAAISHYPELWAAAVDIVGISSFETFMENTGPWRRKLRGSEYGTLKDDREFFRDIDPINHAYKIDTPLQIYHGLNDSRVPVTESVSIAMDMKERRQEVDLTIFNDEGHFTEKKHNHLTMNGNIVKFFEEQLKK